MPTDAPVPAVCAQLAGLFLATDLADSGASFKADWVCEGFDVVAYLVKEGLDTASADHYADLVRSEYVRLVKAECAQRLEDAGDQDAAAEALDLDPCDAEVWTSEEATAVAAKVAARVARTEANLASGDEAAWLREVAETCEAAASLARKAIVDIFKAEAARLEFLDQRCEDTRGNDRIDALRACAEEAGITLPGEDATGNSKQWENVAKALASQGWVRAASAADWMAQCADEGEGPTWRDR